MIRLLVAAMIVGAAGVVAVVLGRRRSQAVPSDLPPSVDISALHLPSGGIVIFVDPDCTACAGVLEVVQQSGLPFAAVDAGDARPLYGVRHYPTTVEVGADGVVRRGWVGPLPDGVLTRPPP